MITVAVGIALILIGLLDVFLTVLHYDGAALLGRLTSRGTWGTVRALTAPMPRRPRTYLRCLGAPLMIPVTLSVWLILQILGFALLYQPGLESGQFHITGDNEAGFPLAVYTSVVTVATLGYGDVTPTTPLFQALTGMQALIGFALLTLTISYLSNVYTALQHLSLLGAELQQQSTDPSDPEGLLAAHLTSEGSRDLGPRLESLRQRLLMYSEGLRRYPIVYYFHSRYSSRSLPEVFGNLGHLAAALRWGLPATHPAATDPHLKALVASITAAMGTVRDHHPTLSLPSFVTPASDAAVADAFCGVPSNDPHLTRFITVVRQMEAIADLSPGDSQRDSYARYRQWLALVGHIDAFTTAVLNDLGRDPAPVHDRSSASTPEARGTFLPD